MILSIIALVLSSLVLIYSIFLAYKVYDLEDYVVEQFKSLVNQLNRINAEEYKVDRSQEDRIVKLESRK